MNEPDATIDEPQNLDDDSAGAVETPRTTFAATAACFICCAVYLALTLGTDEKTWEFLAIFGYYPSIKIWHGQITTLFTSAFIHFDFLHLIFNVYWLWILGKPLERGIGWLGFILFYLASAFVSSAYQLGTSGDTGIGASGVVYAMFGFMWVASRHNPEYRAALPPDRVRWFIGWIFLCIVLSVAGVWNIGNAAHISGLVFGAAVSLYFIVRFRPMLTLAGLVLVVAGAIAPLFWAPWLPGWVEFAAFRAHEKKDYPKALMLYSQVLAHTPDSAWAYFNRAEVNHFLGHEAGSVQDYAKARELDPEIKHDEEAN